MSLHRTPILLATALAFGAGEATPASARPNYEIERTVVGEAGGDPSQPASYEDCAKTSFNSDRSGLLGARIIKLDGNKFARLVLPNSLAPVEVSPPEENPGAPVGYCKGTRTYTSSVRLGGNVVARSVITGNAEVPQARDSFLVSVAKACRRAKELIFQTDYTFKYEENNITASDTSRFSFTVPCSGRIEIGSGEPVSTDG